MKSHDRIENLVERCSPFVKGGLREFAHTFRPEAFYVPTPTDPLTEKFLTLLEDRTLANVLILLHRGGGKTSWVITWLEQLILYRQTNCALYCSLDLTTAQQRTEALKRALEQDRLVLDTFGSYKSDKWAADEWITKPLLVGDTEVHPGTQVVPRGMGQQVRGWLYNNRYRPDLIIVDDIQNRKTVKSETLRKEAWDWTISEVLGAFSVLNDIGPGEFPPKLVVIGNMLHEDCVVNRLREEADKPGSIWGDNVVILPMCDDSLRPTRPTFVSAENCKKIYNTYHNSGDLDIFAQEYQIEVVSSKAKAFKQEYYRYYDEQKEGISSRGGVETVVSVDVSNAKKATSCPAGLVVQTVDLITGAIYVREVVQEQMHPDEQFNLAIDLALRYRSHCISCGTQGPKEWATYAFENAIRQRQAPIEFVEIPETRREGAKEERISGLVPLYRTGVIQHAAHKELDGSWSSHCIPLELAQAKYPHSRYWDAMDAQAQILWLLDHSQRFMQARDQHQEGAAPDEYDELWSEDMAEAPLEGWRVKV